MHENRLFFIFITDIMKKITLLLLLACISIGTMRAQVKGNGYYRVQNVITGRYMSLTTEETRGISMQSTTVDASALLTKKNWDDVSTDPGTIFYIENKGGDQYNIIGQGSSLYKIINYYIRLKYYESANVYRAWQSKSGGTVYLSDEHKYTLGKDTGYVDNNTNATLNWKITAVDNVDNYLGVKPTISANGKYYASYYAGFPFSVASPNMKVYYISSIDEKEGTATYKELTGIIPASTPVIIECGSKNPAENKLKPELTNPTAVKDNIMKGVYFCAGLRRTAHFTSTKFEPTTMRLLSVDENGSLVFNNDEANAYTVMIKEGASRPYKYPYIKAVPHNTGYLPVSANCPKSLKLVKETTGISNITLGNDNKPANVYNMEGKIIKENATSVEGLPEGIYIFKNKKYVVK